MWQPKQPASEVVASRTRTLLGDWLLIDGSGSSHDSASALIGSRS